MGGCQCNSHWGEREANATIKRVIENIISVSCDIQDFMCVLHVTNPAVRSHHLFQASLVPFKPSRTRVALHFISSSCSVLMEIKAICQQPVEHACIINHVCGFLLYRKIYCRAKIKRKRSSKAKSFSKCRGGKMYTSTNKYFSCMQLHSCNCAVVYVCDKERCVNKNIFCILSFDPKIRRVILQRTCYFSSLLLSFSLLKTRNFW